MRSLAIDIGSSFIKAAVMDTDAGELTQVHKQDMPGRLPNPDGRVYEVRIDTVWDAVWQIIQRCCAADAAIEHIVFSTQMHGFVLADTASGEPVYVSWQDARCLNPMPGWQISYLEHLKNMLSRDDMAPSGVYLKPALGLCNLYAIMAQRSAPAGEPVTVYTLGSYFISKLTGRNICHVSNAAPLGLCDIRLGAWRQALIDRLGFGGLRFPEIATDFSPVGTARINGRPVAISPDLGDVQCSVLGAGARKGDIIVNMATAGQVIALSESRSTHNADLAYYELRPYLRGEVCHVVSRMPGGRNLDVLIDFFRELGDTVFGQSISREDLWQRVVEACQTQPETDGLQVDCSFYELPEKLAGGNIANIRRTNLTLNHLIHATMRDIARNYAHYARLIEKNTAPIQRIVFCGGAVRNNVLLQQAIAREMGLPYVLSSAPDEVLEGLFEVCRMIQNQEGSRA